MLAMFEGWHRWTDCPINEAFGKGLAAFGVTEEALLTDTAFLPNAMKNHVVTLEFGAVCEGNLSGFVQTDQGGELTVDGSTVRDANGNVAEILGAIDLNNGVFYVIDTVLLPSVTSGDAPRGRPAPE